MKIFSQTAILFFAFLIFSAADGTCADKSAENQDLHPAGRPKIGLVLSGGDYWLVLTTFSPGATGNVCTEDLVHLFHALGLSTGIDLGELIAVASIVEQHLDTELPSRMLRAGPRFSGLAT